MNNKCDFPRRIWTQMCHIISETWQRHKIENPLFPLFVPLLSFDSKIDCVCVVCRVCVCATLVVNGVRWLVPQHAGCWLVRQIFGATYATDWIQFLYRKRIKCSLVSFAVIINAHTPNAAAHTRTMSLKMKFENRILWKKRRKNVDEPFEIERRRTFMFPSRIKQTLSTVDWFRVDFLFPQQRPLNEKQIFCTKLTWCRFWIFPEFLFCAGARLSHGIACRFFAARCANQIHWRLARRSSKTFPWPLLALCSRCYLAPGFFFVRIHHIANPTSVQRGMGDHRYVFSLPFHFTCKSKCNYWLCYWQLNSLRRICNYWVRTEEWDLVFAFYCDVKRFGYDFLLFVIKNAEQ